MNQKLSKVLKVLESIANKTGATIADTIILAGNIGLEKAIKKLDPKLKFHLLLVEEIHPKSKQN